MEIEAQELIQTRRHLNSQLSNTRLEYDRLQQTLEETKNKLKFKQQALIHSDHSITAVDNKITFVLSYFSRSF